MAADWDVIVVGARCAGSPTAMLLARAGHRVLVVDRATFPSDTLSGHLVHPPGVAALARFGLLERLEATGCPPIHIYAFDFGPFRLAGTPRPVAGIAHGYAPRRTVLDTLLVEAAAEAGAEVRTGFTVEDVVFDDTGRVAGIRGHGRGGASVVERAAVVVGADGHHSRVAKAVDAPRYHERPSYEAAYYAYWSGVPVDGFEILNCPDRVLGALPTHDGLTLVLVAWPLAEFAANRSDVEGNYLKALDLVPGFSERVLAGRRESRFHGTGDLPGWFRKPYGPGWALVGDAGYLKDPCTAQGISDAFRDAELLAGALSDALSGRRPWNEALAAYHHIRDETILPMFELTCGLATLEPPPPETAQLLAAVHGNQAATDDFVSMLAGTVPVPHFFAPENTAAILSAA
jgi:2-polyprenyl-6-methoxyphenol hydroxylase-like FAD-dependent oxidoreductase